VEASIKGFPDEELLAATQTKGVVPKSVYGKTTVTATKNFETLKLVEKGDFVISLRSFQGGIEYAHYRGIISPAYTILKPQEEVVHKYFRYLLKSKRYISGLTLLVTGIREGQNIDTGKFKDSYLPLPSKLEQTDIANFLDYKLEKIARFIKKKNQLIGLLTEQKSAIINQAVTKGLNPNTKLKPSGVEWLGDIPEHWEAKRLKYIGKIINGYAFKSHWFKDKGIKVLKITNIQPMQIVWDETSYVDEKYYEELENFRIKKNDLVFALTRPIIKAGIKAAFIKSDEKILINQRNAVFSLKDENTLTEWIYFVLLDKSFEKRFEKEIDFTNQQPNISSKDIENIEFPIPSLIEQTKIVKHIETELSIINKTISTIEKEIELVEEYKTALIAEAVTGKIDVRDFKIPAVETPLTMVAEEATNNNKTN
jgi:type I restriction enzyme S subunit